MLPIYIVETILVPLIVAPFSFLKSSPFQDMVFSTLKHALPLKNCFW